MKSICRVVKLEGADQYIIDSDNKLYIRPGGGPGYLVFKCIDETYNLNGEIRVGIHPEIMEQRIDELDWLSYRPI